MSNPFTNQDGKTLPTPVALAVIAFAALVVACVVGLVFVGRDIAAIVYFLTAFVPATIGLVVVASKQEKVLEQAKSNAADLAQVKKAVNGQLDAKFDRVHEAIKDNGVNADPSPTTGNEFPNG